MNNTFKTVLLLGSLTGLLLLIGNILGGVQGTIVALIIATVMNFVSWFWSDKLALASYKAKPAKDPKIIGMVHRLADKAQLPHPGVYIVPSSTPNAFATGRNPKNAAVALTTGIIDLLSKDELEGVIAHELAHIKHRDILISSVAATVAGAITTLAMIARYGGSRNQRQNILGLLVLSLIAPFVTTIIQFGISRSREFAADKGGANIAGSGEPLARALLKLSHGNKKNPLRFGSKTRASMFIINPFAGKAFRQLFSTHPPVEERVKRLRMMN